MRSFAAVFATALFLAFANAAAADPVAIAPVAFSPDFERQLATEYGEREGAVLQQYIERRVSAELRQAGAQIAESAPTRIEITLIDADPTKPTFGQMARNLGLDYALSVSVGGAELSAVIRGADGVRAEIRHRRFAWGLDDANFTGGAWGDARRSIRLFAIKLARAYRESLSSVDTEPS